MVAVKYSIDDLKAKRAAKTAERRLTNPEKALKDCGLVLLRSVAKNFKAGGRPVRWHPSKRALAAGGQTLVKTARLMRSITMTVHGKILRVGTNVKYARIHQLGGKINQNVTVRQHWRYMDKAFGEPIPARSVTVRQHQRQMDTYIPARPFLKIQDADWRIMKRIVGNYAVGKLK
jgi:phage gpG-like protein